MLGTKWVGLKPRAKSDTTKCLPRREKLPTKPHNANYIRIDAWGMGSVTKI